jgi:squalene-hopene cyclase-like protein
LLLQAAAAHPTNAPLSTAEIKQSMDRGIEWLIKNQNKDGSWGSANKTKDLNIFAPVPGAHHGFKAGVTAMSIEALIETGAAKESAEARRALERGEEWLLKNVEHVRRADGVAIYNVWAHAYAIQALVDMHQRISDPERQKQIKEVIATQIDRLRRYESVDGGWGYYDFSVGSQKPAAVTTSFTTATVLYALHEVAKIGMEAPSNIVQRGITMVNRQRKPDHTYLYSFDHKYRPMWEINRKGGSLGRSQACNIALRVWGDKTITDDVLAECLDRLVERYEWLSIGRKRPIPHESWFLIAGYFFYYGHYYAALCADLLPPDRAAGYRRDLARIIVPLQEKDGSWWDYPLYNYHQPWGTSFALMTLQRCLPVQSSTTTGGKGAP